MKLCSRCKRWKTRDEYTRARNKPDGHYNYCTECRKVIRRIDYQNGKKKSAAKSRRQRYGITASQFALMKGRQEDACAICRTPFASKLDTHLDHDHKTGAIRGILCNRCNHGIGVFKDDPERLSRAISYLKQPQRLPREYRLFDPSEGETA